MACSWAQATTCQSLESAVRLVPQITNFQGRPMNMGIHLRLLKLNGPKAVAARLELSEHAWFLGGGGALELAWKVGAVGGRSLEPRHLCYFPEAVRSAPPPRVPSYCFPLVPRSPGWLNVVWEPE